MGCGSSASAGAAAQPEDAASKYAESSGSTENVVVVKPKSPKSAAVNDNPAPPSDSGAEQSRRASRRVSAQSRIREVCPEGFEEAAVAYNACIDRGEEWGSNPEDAKLKEKVGAQFEEVLTAFEGFDTDGDRHVDVQELARAMETLGVNPGGEVTDDIKQMFSEADVNGDKVIDFFEFLGMMGAVGAEQEAEGAE